MKTSALVLKNALSNLKMRRTKEVAFGLSKHNHIRVVLMLERCLGQMMCVY